MKILKGYIQKESPMQTEAFRLNTSHIPDGIDVVVVVKAGLRDKGYAETSNSMIHLLKLHNVYIE